MAGLIHDAQWTNAPEVPRRHCHMLCEMVYVHKGCARFFVAGKTYTAAAGSVVFLSGLEEHEVQVVQAPYERCFLTVSPAELAGVLTSVFRNRPEGFTHCVDLSQRKAIADGLFAALLREFSCELALARLATESLLTQILIEVYRACPENFGTATSESAARIAQVQLYMERNFDKPIAIAELARKFYLSPHHLSHAFKRQVGYSPKQYLRLLRLSCARELLESTEHAVSQIARLAGFADVSNFIRAYRECYGVSPGKSREKPLDR